MGHPRKRALRWAAPLTLVAVAGLAACGDDDGTSVRTAGVATGRIGSDVHLENLADDIAARARAESGSDVHLENLADDIAARARAEAGRDVHAAAEAEAIEHDAHLAGNAATYGAAGASAPAESSDDEFVPGTRRMPVR